MRLPPPGLEWGRGHGDPSPPPLSTLPLPTSPSSRGSWSPASPPSPTWMHHCFWGEVGAPCLVLGRKQLMGIWGGTGGMLQGEGGVCVWGGIQLALIDHTHPAQVKCCQFIALPPILSPLPPRIWSSCPLHGRWCVFVALRPLSRAPPGDPAPIGHASTCKRGVTAEPGEGRGKTLVPSCSPSLTATWLERPSGQGRAAPSHPTRPTALSLALYFQTPFKHIWAKMDRGLETWRCSASEGAWDGKWGNRII